MILRQYQTQASDAIMREFQESDSTLIVVPTGGGKTIIIADVIRRFHPQRAIVLAHREELIFQARQKIEAFTGFNCEIEMADLTAAANLWQLPEVIISTVQTQNSGTTKKRMTRFNPNDFGLLVIDEAHHCTANSYRAVIDYYKSNPDLRVLGVTATPDRTDEEALGQVFKTVAFDYEILDAIHDGYLVPVEQQLVSISGLDFSNVRTTAGDLNGADLAAVMEQEEMMQGVASASIEIVGTHRSVVFTSSVKHAETISSIFNRHRNGMCEWVCGTTPKEERRRILDDFQNGRVQVVANCAVLTEGFDNTGVEVIIMARPTKSRSLYAQMAGRAMRPLPGVIDGLEAASADERKSAIATSAKSSCKIIDFVGNSGRHKLMTTADILGGNVSEEAIEKALEVARKSGKAVRISEELDEAQARIVAEMQKRRQEEAARKARLVAKAQYSMQSVDPFNILQMTPHNARGWDSQIILSEKQRAILQKQGIDPDSMPAHQAKQLLNEIFRRWNNGLCTLKQAKWLSKHGYETKSITLKAASAIMDSWAKNNWQRPAEG